MDSKVILGEFKFARGSKRSEQSSLRFFVQVRGEVVSSEKISRTEISSEGGGKVHLEPALFSRGIKGSISSPKIISESKIDHEFWVKPQEGQPEEQFILSGQEVPLRKGQFVTIIGAANDRQDNWPVFLYNHATNARSWLPEFVYLESNITNGTDYTFGGMCKAAGISFLVYIAMTGIHELIDQSLPSILNDAIALGILGLWVFYLQYTIRRRIRLRKEVDRLGEYIINQIDEWENRIRLSD